MRTNILKLINYIAEYLGYESGFRIAVKENLNNESSNAYSSRNYFGLKYL